MGLVASFTSAARRPGDRLTWTAVMIRLSPAVAAEDALLRW